MVAPTVPDIGNPSQFRATVGPWMTYWFTPGGEALRFDGSGDFNIDAGTFFVDVSANRVGLGTITPAQALDVVGKVQVSDDIILSGAVLTTIYSSDNTAGIQIATDATSVGPYIIQYGSAHATLANTTVQEADTLLVRKVDGTTYHFSANSTGMGIGKTSPSTTLDVAGPMRCASYTVATVPSASTAGAGSLIFVTDETGGATHASSDGTNWRRMSDRAIVA